MSPTSDSPDESHSVTEELRNLRIVTVTGWRFFLRLATGFFFAFQILSAIGFVALSSIQDSSYSPYSSGNDLATLRGATILGILVAGALWGIVDDRIQKRFDTTLPEDNTERSAPTSPDKSIWDIGTKGE